MSKLVICEKPSVGQSISKVLGANQRYDGYLEGGGYVVSWCVGHLVELAQPEAYDEKYAKWRKEDLPILPDRWQYRVSGSTKKQFSILKDLMNRNDVSTIVNACDAGREGELIFRLVYRDVESGTESRPSVLADLRSKAATLPPRKPPSEQQHSEEVL